MRLLLSVCLLPLLAGGAGAQAPTTPKPLILSPAAAPEPALKYRLLPELIDQRPGNAAEHYRKAGDKLAAIPNEQLLQTDEWINMPLADLPRDRVRTFLASCKEIFEIAEAGARCESCDWDLTTEIRAKGIQFSLEGMQRMRTLAMLCRLRMRLEIAEGHYDRAVYTARVGLSMARHVGDAPTLISSLIGIALASVTLNGVEELMTQPGAPNLVWALSTLPRSFIDLRRPLQGERLMAYSCFPGMDRVLLDPDADLTAEENKKICDFLTNKDNMLSIATNRTALAALLVAKNEEAKKYLEKGGWTRERLNRMSPLQVGMLHALTEYDQYLDELVKWQALPYWEAQPALQQANQRRRQMRAQGWAMLVEAPAVPLAALLVPAVDKVFNARTRLDRRIAVLAAVEAIRLHAASNGGQLPETLASVRVAPVPLDPGTGKPFVYRVEGTKGFLSGPLLPGQQPVAGNIISYEITFRPAQP
jgi:hypothetical protein